MPKPKKELSAAEKATAERMRAYFDKNALGFDIPDTTEGIAKLEKPQREKIKQAAQKLMTDRGLEAAKLTKEQRKDHEKYPPLKLPMFPSFLTFSAYMLVQAEESANVWKKRFEEGRMRAAEGAGTSARKLRGKVDQIKKLVQQLKDMNLPVNVAGIAASLGMTEAEFSEAEKAVEKGVTESEDDEDEDTDDTEAAPEAPIATAPKPPEAPPAPIPVAPPPVAPAAPEAAPEF